MRKFWTDIGFVLAVEQPTLGIMETDWAENRVNMPDRCIEGLIGKVADVFFNSYKRDKFRTRLEQGTEPGTVDIYISHRGAEQVPPTLIDNRSPAAFVWAVMPADPGIEAEMLGRAMVRFGAPTQTATGRRAGNHHQSPARARAPRARDGRRLSARRRRRLRSRVAPRRASRSTASDSP
jgi:outer membrane protein assembly factor BamC